MDDEPSPDEAPKGPGLGDRLEGLTGRLEEGRQSFQPGLWARLIGIGVVVVYLVLFVVLNTRHVPVKFVFTTTRVSLIWVILLSLAAGVVLGVLLSQLRRHRTRKRAAS